MLELKKPGMAGTLESSDVLVIVKPNPEKGIKLNITSDVIKMFGKQIEETVRQTLKEFDVTDALVDVNDKGALDFALKARVQCAICRSAEIKYDWSKEDSHV